MKRTPMKPGPGQESVWDYPRPAIMEPTSKHLRVVFAGTTLAETRDAYRVLETSHPPTYYLSPSDVDTERLRASRRHSFCEWKGEASYFDLVGPAKDAQAAAWCYAKPSASFAPMAGYISFYAHAVDACYVDGEMVQAQEGDFYGGWITRDVVGPFKGAPGTWGW